MPNALDFTLWLSRLPARLAMSTIRKSTIATAQEPPKIQAVAGSQPMDAVQTTRLQIEKIIPPAAIIRPPCSRSFLSPS